MEKRNGLWRCPQLPVGGLNEKIEGYYRICAKAGLDGQQGVLIPSRNRRHLMLDAQVVDAVARGLFHIYSAEHVSDGMALLTGLASGMDVSRATRLDPGGYAADTVLGQAQKTLKAFRHACQLADHPKVGSRHQPK